VPGERGQRQAMIFRRSATQAGKPRLAYYVASACVQHGVMLRYRNMQPQAIRPCNAHRCSAISGYNRCILSPICFLSGRSTAHHGKNCDISRMASRSRFASSLCAPVELLSFFKVRDFCYAWQRRSGLRKSEGSRQPPLLRNLCCAKSSRGFGRCQRSWSNL